MCIIKKKRKTNNPYINFYEITAERGDKDIIKISKERLAKNLFVKLLEFVDEIHEKYGEKK